MRIAFISDIHGNMVALEAVLKDIKRRNVQQIICLGDVATIGLQPQEVIETLQDLKCPCIMGNHDLPLIDSYKAMELTLFADDLFHSLCWTLDHVTEKHLDFIRSFETTITIPDNSGRELLCYHGVPQNNYTGIFPATSESELRPYLDGIHHQVFVGGHTHLQMNRNYNGKLLLNPGSVGHVFNSSHSPQKEPRLQPWAEYGILAGTQKQISFEMKRIPFDVEKVKSIIRRTDHPLKEWWMKQY